MEQNGEWNRLSDDDKNRFDSFLMLYCRIVCVIWEDLFRLSDDFKQIHDK